MATATKTAPSASMQKKSKGRIVVDWLTTTDHKKIGYLYLITSFIYFLIGGVMALVIRAQLAAPGLDIVQTKEQYNQLFTMHGTIMLLMFATPLFAVPQHAACNPHMMLKLRCSFTIG
jgi:cytochrome c oxidase subunit 1